MRKSFFYLFRNILVTFTFFFILSIKAHASFDSPDFITNQPKNSIEFQEKLGDYTVNFINLSAVALTIYHKDFEGFKQYAISTGLTALTTSALKFSVKRYRPNNSNQDSFPSGHSSFAFSGASFIYDRYGAEFGIPAYMLASYVAYSRVAAKKHHITDVVAGAALSIGMSRLFVKPMNFNVFNTHVELTTIPVISSDGVNLTFIARF